MKKKLLAVLFVAGFCSLAKADGREPNTYASQAIYVSSNPSDLGQCCYIALSTTPALLHTVVVNSTGTAEGRLEIFNARQSTTVASGTSKIATINTAFAQGTYTYDLLLSSGLWIWNRGVQPANVTITYKTQGKQQ